MHPANALTLPGLMLASFAACAGGETTTVVGYGFVELDADPGHRIVGLETTLVVPAQPPGTGTLFLWPGLQPQTGGAGYDPIGNGVLQPVLAWGTSCAPGIEPAMYATWWISAQYFDEEGTDPAHTGCYGGAIMSAPVAEPLRIRMILAGTLWQQTVVGPGGSVGFDEDLMDAGAEPRAVRHRGVLGGSRVGRGLHRHDHHVRVARRRRLRRGASRAERLRVHPGAID